MTSHPILRAAAQAARDRLPGWYSAEKLLVNGLYRVDHPYIAAANPAVVIALLDELDASRAENERLREALQPFGEVDGEGDEDFPDTTKVTIQFGRSTVYFITLADLRRARAALPTPPPGEVEKLREAVEAIAETLAFNAVHLVAEDSKKDALATLSAARDVMHASAVRLRALKENPNAR